MFKQKNFGKKNTPFVLVRFFPFFLADSEYRELGR